MARSFEKSMEKILTKDVEKMFHVAKASYQNRNSTHRNRRNKVDYNKLWFWLSVEIFFAFAFFRFEKCVRLLDENCDLQVLYLSNLPSNRCNSSVIYRII